MKKYHHLYYKENHIGSKYKALAKSLSFYSQQQIQQYFSLKKTTDTYGKSDSGSKR